MADPRLDSSDPLERRDAARRVIRRLAEYRGVSLSALARMTDHKQQVFHRLLTDGEQVSLPLADLAILVEQLGIEVLEPWVRAAGHRMVRETHAKPTAEGMIASTAQLLRESAEAAADAIATLADGRVTPSERAGILRQLDDVRRAANEVETAIEGASIARIGTVR